VAGATLPACLGWLAGWLAVASARQCVVVLRGGRSTSCFGLASCCPWVPGPSGPPGCRWLAVASALRRAPLSFCVAATAYIGWLPVPLSIHLSIYLSVCLSYFILSYTLLPHLVYLNYLFYYFSKIGRIYLIHMDFLIYLYTLIYLTYLIYLIYVLFLMYLTYRILSSCL
jgi:hypothetical protein